MQLTHSNFLGFYVNYFFCGVLSIAKRVAEKKRLKQRQRNLTFAISAIAVMFAVLAVLAGWFGVNANRAEKEAIKQKSIAEAERDRAESAEFEAKDQADIALVRQLAAQALPALQNPSLINGYVDVAALLSVQSRKVKEGRESASNMLRTLQNRGHLNATLQGHSDHVWSVAFSPDGSKVISGSWDNTVRLWDVKTGEIIGEPWQGNGDNVNSLTFSPDGSKVVSGSLDKTVRLWDLKTGETIGEPWQGHSAEVWSLAFSGASLNWRGIETSSQRGIF